jgi:hypothetical protein
VRRTAGARDPARLPATIRRTRATQGLRPAIPSPGHQVDRRVPVAQRPDDLPVQRFTGRTAIPRCAPNTPGGSTPA